MAHYAYKAACYDIDRIKYQELVNRFEEEEGREHDGDSNYDGDNWYIMAMWINELRAKVAELESQASPTVSEDRKDAERYRWLCSSSTGPSQIWELLSDDCNPPILTLKSMGDLDTAIDQAMQEDKP